MSNNGSQKLDIEDICDAVVGSIEGNVSDLLASATSTVFTNQQMKSLEILSTIGTSLSEIVQHLRIITGEDFEDDC